MEIERDFVSDENGNNDMLPPDDLWSLRPTLQLVHYWPMDYAACPEANWRFMWEARKFCQNRWDERSLGTISKSPHITKQTDQR
ncbi:hypothetical protein RND71_016313 [Anisodus tanguticus]|uniref:Uncharacterized protein n=1 Tax=Anisodus tanguticus TaxID=243964 RepID=A0AAE1S804_9SOLA|nr:hypothetical protein RND71_016313 [Anisodus tanguticus]